MHLLQHKFYLKTRIMKLVRLE